jgi:PTH1 family peptidyl-tRNA hydrolase
VRLGIGHPGHKDAVAGFVLRDFAKVDQDWLAALLNGIANGVIYLADGDGSRFMNEVALQTSPARSSKSTKTKLSPAAGPTSIAEDTRNPMQRLLDRLK